jgi:cysteine desulfurase
MFKSLYFDTASTTPVLPEVVAKMIACLEGEDCFANPSSLNYQLGQISSEIIEKARVDVAHNFNCKSDEVVFTSGATEANNLAIRGIAFAHSSKGRHLITSSIEHKSVLETYKDLESEGFQVTYLSPNAQGWVEPESVRRALRDDTLLVSLMHTNNETGIQQPISEVAEVLSDAGILFHVDASQAAGKFLIDLESTAIDLLTLSAHKFYGPKGVGCLIVRNRRFLKIKPLVSGGGQEFSLRSGTHATHQIVGLSEALHLVSSRREAELIHVAALKELFLGELGKSVCFVLNGDQSHCSPYIVNLSIKGIGSDALINQLSSELAISSGSACSSGTVDPSYVLRAMGIEGENLYGAVRVSFSCKHTYDDVKEAVERIIAAVHRMQTLEKMNETE